VYQEQLSQALALLGAIDPVSQGAGSVNSPSIDLQKVKRALFVLDVGVFGASATVDMKLQVSPDNSVWTDLANVTPATFTGAAIAQLVAAGGNNRQARLEIRADQLAAITSPAGARYARVVVTVGVAATLICVLCFGGESEQKPASQYNGASVAQSVVVAGPS
jgi:hypothetical protein